MRERERKIERVCEKERKMERLCSDVGLSDSAVCVNQGSETGFDCQSRQYVSIKAVKSGFIIVWLGDSAFCVNQGSERGVDYRSKPRWLPSTPHRALAWSYCRVLGGGVFS